jgi:hypothetical protein
MIQIDMQMPKNCLDCPCCNEYLMCAIPINDRKWSEKDVTGFSEGRPEWCPLKEQEPKPVKVVKNVYNYEFYFCPNCDRQFYGCYKRPSYCDRCGQAVKWE